MKRLNYYSLDPTHRRKLFFPRHASYFCKRYTEPNPQKTSRWTRTVSQTTWKANSKLSWLLGVNSARTKNKTQNKVRHKSKRWGKASNSCQIKQKDSRNNRQNSSPKSSAGYMGCKTFAGQLPT